MELVRCFLFPECFHNLEEGPVAVLVGAGLVEDPVEGHLEVADCTDSVERMG